MGKFKKGESGNPAGRPRGAKDKAQSSIKEWVKELLDKNRATIEADLKKCEPADRLRVLLKLLEYVLPKQAAVQAKIDFEALSEEQINDIINRLTGGETNEDSN